MKCPKSYTLKQNSNITILHGRYHGCQWHGDTRSQGINSHDNVVLLQEELISFNTLNLIYYVSYNLETLFLHSFVKYLFEMKWFSNSLCAELFRRNLNIYSRVFL